MKKCNLCNINYPENKNFCRKCGAPLIAAYNIDKKTQAKKEVLEEQLKVEPLKTSLLNEYAQLLYDNGMFDEAISTLLRILAINEDDSKANELLFRSYNKVKKNKEASELGWILYPSKMDDFVFIEILAETEYGLNNNSKALELYERVLMYNPNNLNSIYGKALILLETEHFEKSLTLFESLYKEEKNNRIICLYKSVSEYNAGNFENAINILVPILSDKNLSLSDIHNQRGIICLLNCLCKTESKLETIDKWFSLLDVEILKENKRLVDEENLIKLTSEIIKVYLSKEGTNTANIQYALRTYYNANSIHFSEQAHPLVASMWYDISILQESTGLFESALDSIEKAIKLSPENQAYKEHYKRVRLLFNAEKKKGKRKRIIIVGTSITVILIVIVVSIIFSRINENNFWEEAKKKNTSYAYFEYIEKYPGGRFFDDAIDYEEDAYWRESLEKNTIQGLEDYLKFYPEGKYIVSFDYNGKDETKGKCKYIGQHQDGFRDGLGICFYETNSEKVNGRYAGNWKLNLPNGNGSKSWNNGDYYEGEWKNGLRVGYGKMFYAKDNTRYEGHWKNDMLHGYGKMIWTSGDIYEGNFQYDYKHGNCKYYNKQSDAWYIGTMNYGTGKVYNASGTYYFEFQ